MRLSLNNEVNEERSKRHQTELERCKRDLEQSRRYQTLMLGDRSERTDDDRAFLKAYREEYDKRSERVLILTANLKNNLAELKELYEKVTDNWVYNDLLYRFYHHSFKVYWLQGYTVEMVSKLRSMVPDDVRLNPFFLEILEQGLGKEFTLDHNQEWGKHTRPIVEAFLHAKYFLEMAIKTGETIEGDPRSLPSYYAGLLYLYNLR